MIDPHPEDERKSKRWTVLCTKCGGNGVVKIPGGVSTCDRCEGRCYEPESAPADLEAENAKLRQKLGQEWVSRITQSSDPEASVVGGDASPMPIPREEWLGRYRQRLIGVAGLSEQHAQQCVEAGDGFEAMSDGYEDDPEGAADMEMSYWDGE